ncbi:phage tail protein [Acinetobacter calcoaceticus]|uniref:phage tail protein n=1 Tax=Acinetobacter calcoaceticus TaxID=471 RepID=UPI0018DD760D|nr:phage tail protein [Acinetobacter calcoaceticus]
MDVKIVYQFNQAGLFVGKTVADKSPREQNVFLIPANCTETPAPESWPDDVWPRFNGSDWILIPKPKIQEPMTAEQKLTEFLQNNPDVMNLITPNT